MPPRSSRSGSVDGSDVVEEIEFLQSVVKDAWAAFQTETNEKVGRQSDMSGSTGTLSETLWTGERAKERVNMAAQVSSITRKRRQEKCLSDLAAARERADAVVSTAARLSEAQKTNEQKLRAAENGREDAVERVGELMEQLESSVATIRETQAAKLAVERERNALQSKVAELEEANQTLNQALSDRESALEASAKGSSERLDHAKALESRQDSLKQELAAAHGELQSTQEALYAVQQREAEKAETYQRQHAVIAKLTADNVMQLIQLKEQTRSLQQHKRDVEALRAEIETKRSPWFDEIRSTVEEQLRGSFEKCEQLKRELEQSREQHTAQSAVAENRACALEHELSVLREALERMEADLEASRERESQLEGSIAASENDRERLNQSLYEAQAELKFSTAAMTSLREELSATWGKNKDTEDQVQRQDARIAELREEKRQLEAQVLQSHERQRQQERANTELMKRKEQIEWELVEARSVLSSPRARLSITHG